MTQLGNVKRKTQFVYQGRLILVELHPKYMTLRLDGARIAESAVNVSYDQVYEMGLKKRAMEAK